MNAWQEYKKKIGTTRPWDMLNSNVEHSSKEEAATRMRTCEECPSLLKVTHQCRECGCFMKLKVKISTAKCPLGKW